MCFIYFLIQQVLWRKLRTKVDHLHKYINGKVGNSHMVRVELNWITEGYYEKLARELIVERQWGRQILALRVQMCSYLLHLKKLLSYLLLKKQL